MSGHQDDTMDAAQFEENVIEDEEREDYGVMQCFYCGKQVQQKGVDYYRCMLCSSKESECAKYCLDCFRRSTPQGCSMLQIECKKCKQECIRKYGQANVLMIPI